MDRALAEKPEFDKLKAEFVKMQAEGDDIGIFEKLGIEVKHDANNNQYLLIDNYSGIANGRIYTLNELGIDEDALMSRVRVINGTIDLKGSAIKSAPVLRSINRIIFDESNKISDLRSLEKIADKNVYWIK